MKIQHEEDKVKVSLNSLVPCIVSGSIGSILTGRWFVVSNDACNRSGISIILIPSLNIVGTGTGYCYDEIIPSVTFF
jgi:hypothetical protein